MWCSLVIAGVLVLGAASPPSEIREDGFTFRAPPGFHVLRSHAHRDSQVGAVALNQGAPRLLSTVLARGDDAQAATLLVSIVDEDFAPTPSTRDDFTAAAIQHFGDLALPFALQSAERAGQQVPRVEVVGTLRRAGQLRTVLVAGLAGEGAHLVVVASVPADAWEKLGPELAASLETFRFEPAPRRVSRAFAGGLAAALAGALVVSIVAWARRPARRQE